MSWNNRVRQIHRWLSMVFTVLVIVNIVVNIVPVAQEEFTLWVGFFTLLPLTLLLFTGLYLFVLPYTTKWRSGRRAV
jgi:quinol-cytochrome oxidoreductase complex cytochrome b subunit